MRDLERAIGHFEELLGKRAKDGSSMMRIERCRQFMKVPPGNNWQGIAIAEAT